MKKTLQELRKSPNYSFSSFSTYLQCSLKWYYRYIEKVEPESTSSNLIFGSTIHKTLDMVADRKMLNQTVTYSEIRDCFSLEWGNQLACAKSLDLESPEEATELHDKGIEMIEVYLNQWQDKKIVAHADAFSLNVEGISKPLIGEYDLLVQDSKGNISIIDWKTAARKWNEDKPHKDHQATLYCFAHEQLTGIMPSFEFHVITKGKYPAVQILPTTRTEDDSARLIKIFKNAEKGINAGCFVPNEASFYCSKCEFSQHCAGWGKCQKVA